MVTDRHRMSIRQGENWGEFYNLQSDPTEVNNLFDEASAEQIRATLTETMLGQIIELIPACLPDLKFYILIFVVFRQSLTGLKAPRAHKSIEQI